MRSRYRTASPWAPLHPWLSVIAILALHGTPARAQVTQETEQASPSAPAPSTPAPVTQPPATSPPAASPLPAQAPATPPQTHPEEETLPPPPEPAATTSAEGPVPQAPAGYRVPPPPAGARYPGPAPQPSESDGFSPQGEIRLPSRISTRLRVLSTDLEALASQGGPSLTNGILSIVSGGLSIALGALLDEAPITGFMYVFGATSIARGTVDLIFSPDPDEAALQFSHMPMRSVAEVRLRLGFGERALRGLADDSRTARLLDASLSIAGGVAGLPLVLVPLQEEDREIEALDVFVLVGSGISILTGLIDLLTPSEAERRDEAYTALKARLRAQPSPASSAARLGLDIGPGHAAITLRRRF